MADIKKGQWVTVAAIVQRVLPPFGPFTHEVELAAFEHAEPSPQIIPTSPRGSHSPESGKPIHSRRLLVQLTDLQLHADNLNVGAERGVLAFVTHVEGAGKEAMLTVTVSGQRLQGPASEAVLSPD